jgi:hypothetical protein
VAQTEIYEIGPTAGIECEVSQPWSHVGLGFNASPIRGPDGYPESNGFTYLYASVPFGRSAEKICHSAVVASVSFISFV